MRRKMYSTGCKRYPLSRIQPLSRAEGAPAPLTQGSRAVPITFVHTCTYCFRAAFVYLSLSLLLPQSGNKIQLCPLAVIRSRFGFAISRSRTAAACLSRCIRHWRRSKAKPLRGSRGRSRTEYRVRKSAYRSYARRRRAALIRHGAGCAAPRHLPQGEGYVLRAVHRFAAAALRRSSPGFAAAGFA